MFEWDTLQSVGELDVDAQVVGIGLELVSGHEPAILIDIQGQLGDRAVKGEAPMRVAIRVRVVGEESLFLGHGLVLG